MYGRIQKSHSQNTPKAFLRCNKSRCCTQLLGAFPSETTTDHVLSQQKFSYHVVRRNFFLRLPQVPKKENTVGRRNPLQTRNDRGTSRKTSSFQRHRGDRFQTFSASLSDTNKDGRPSETVRKHNMGARKPHVDQHTHRHTDKHETVSRGYATGSRSLKPTTSLPSKVVTGGVRTNHRQCNNSTR